MLRRCCALLLATVVVLIASEDVFACGDKFLRLGRSARFRRYASVHPAAILVYAPDWTPKGIKAFEAILAKGGHTPTTVTTVPSLAQALASGKYELLITGYDHVDAARPHIDALPAAQPLVLPVVYKPTKQQSDDARTRYVCLLRPDRMNNFQALAEIDRLFDLQLKRGTVAPDRR